MGSKHFGGGWAAGIKDTSTLDTLPGILQLTQFVGCYARTCDLNQELWVILKRIIHVFNLFFFDNLSSLHSPWF